MVSARLAEPAGAGDGGAGLVGGAMPTLHWEGRERDLTAHERVATRLLVEEPGLSFGAPSENLLVQGDNLEALKALLPYYRGEVRCIYIDPPYNTGSAFEHYPDNLAHAQWLGMMVPRLQLLREFLREDGSIWVSIDDREGHYLKVVMDEVFGRENFVANTIWQKKYAPANDAIWLSDTHDHVHLFAKKRVGWRPNPLPRTQDQDALYRNEDADPRGPWMSDNYTCAKSATERPNLFYAITNPNTGEEIWPSRTRVWAYEPAAHARHVEEGRLYWGRNGTNSTPRLKKYLAELRRPGRVPDTVWLHSDVSHTQDAKREAVALCPADPFPTPKPERLIQRILHIATDPGDLVMDSFLGSGTTAAVAHKMGRRWIGIEMGDHARTHCAPRLKKVVEGEQGGISEAVGWQGGGGFRFCTLGAALFDAAGRIDPAIPYAALAAHVWLAETRTPRPADAPPGPVLGTHDGRAVALLYNGILGDRTPRGGNVLTHTTLRLLREAAPEGPLVVYAAASRLAEETMRAAGVTFRQTPYDIRGRR